MYGLCDYDDFTEEYPEGSEEDYDDFRSEQIDNWAEYYATPTEEDAETDESEIEYLN